MLKHVTSSWAITVLTVMVTYVLMPFTINSVGESTYGTWLLISSITGYLNLLLLGAPMASARALATTLASDDPECLNRTVASIAVLMLGLGALALLVGAILFLFFRTVYRADSFVVGANVAFAVAVFQCAIGFVMQVPYALVAARQDFLRRNGVLALTTITRLVLSLIVLRLAPTLVALALIQLSIATLEFIGLSILIRRIYPEVRIDLSKFRVDETRSIVAFGGYVLLLNLAAQLTFQSDSVVIGRFIGVESIPTYAIANSLIVNLLQFMIAIAAIVMPGTARLVARGATDDVRVLFLKWSKVSFSLSLVAASFFLVCGPGFVGWWIGPKFQTTTGDVLRILMLSSIVFLPMRGVALPTLVGMGFARWPTIAFVGAGVVNVGMSVLLARSFGLVGVALGTAIPNAVVAIVVIGMACRALNVPVHHFLSYVVWKPLLGGVVLVSIAALIAKQIVSPTGFNGLAVNGLVGVLTAGVLGVGFVFRGDPHIRIPRPSSLLRST